MSQFTFLQREWTAVFEAASKAEGAVHADPRTACFYARRALELAVSWAFKHDPGLRRWGNTLSQSGHQDLSRSRRRISM
jgi:type I restriction enzyme R subunit